MFDRELSIPTETTQLAARLRLPERARALIVLAHGSDAIHEVERDTALAKSLARADLGVMTIELLGGMHGREQGEQARRHGMHVLTQRLVATCDFLADQPETAHLPLILFGIELGASAALAAAVARPQRVLSVVCWDGELGLVGSDLIRRVQAPTLMLVSDHEREPLLAAEACAAQLSIPRGIKVVPQAFARDLQGELVRSTHAWVDTLLRGLDDKARAPRPQGVHAS